MRTKISKIHKRIKFGGGIWLWPLFDSHAAGMRPRYGCIPTACKERINIMFLPSDASLMGCNPPFPIPYSPLLIVHCPLFIVHFSPLFIPHSSLIINH